MTIQAPARPGKNNLSVLIQENFTLHFEELRKRVLVSLASITLVAGLSFFFSDRILNFLLSPIQPFVARLYFFSPAEAFLVKLKLSFMGGMILASPVVISQIWLFVSPGLYLKEKRVLLPLILSTTLFFLVGVIFSYALLLPAALKFLLAFGSGRLAPMISVGSYLSLVYGLALACGIAFNLPCVCVALTALGTVDEARLRSWRKPMVVVFFVLAAFLTPSPDVASQILLALPLVLLYELSIFASRVVFRMRIAARNRVSSNR